MNYAQLDSMREAGTTLNTIDTSIVIPTYNRAKLLAKCLAGLARQRPVGARVEVVVVDDGSSDDTPACIEAARRGFPFPLRYVRKPNGGAASARNAGIRASCGAEHPRATSCSGAAGPPRTSGSIRMATKIRMAWITKSDNNHSFAGRRARQSAPFCLLMGNSGIDCKSLKILEAARTHPAAGTAAQTVRSSRTSGR